MMFSNSKRADAMINSAMLIRGGFEENARATEELSHIIAAEGKANRNVRNRVDLSLAEYERLKAELEKAQQAERYWESIYVKMGLPKLIEATVIPDSVKVFTDIDPCKMKKYVSIHFAIENDGQAYLDRMDESGYLQRGTQL